MGNNTATLQGAGASALGAKPALQTQTPPSRQASHADKLRRAGAASMIDEAFPGGMAFLLPPHRIPDYRMLSGPNRPPEPAQLAGSGAGHPHAG